MSKKLLAAGIVKDYLFDTVEEMENYIDKLKADYKESKVLETYERSDRSVIIRVSVQYNSTPLIQLYKN